MVNAQEWLDKEYPIEKRKNVLRILASRKKLEGNLVIEDFPKLKRLEIFFNDDLTSLELVNLPSLERFDAKRCGIVRIKIKNCDNVTSFKINHNKLSSTDFLVDLNAEKLELLSIHSNNFPKQNLSFLSSFINLEKLSIQNNYDEEEAENFKKTNKYNRFYGSLWALRELKKLKWINITNTDIDSGLEYLSESVRKIGCGNSSWATEMNCKKIREEIIHSVKISGIREEELQKIEEGEPDSASDGLDYYRLAPWRQAQEILLEEKPLVKNLKKRVQYLEEWKT